MTIEKIPHTARTGIIVGAVLLLAMLLCGQMRSNAQSGKSTSSLACVQRASFRQEPEFWISWRPSEGAKPIRLLKGTEPALSPDGKTLACVVDMTVNPGADDQALILVNLKTQKKLEILRPRTWIRCPRWSPHGDRLAVILWDKKQSQRYLCVLQADGSGLKEIAREGRGGVNGIWGFSWAADGSLVFQDMQNFVRMDSDGKTLEKVPLAALYGKSSGATSSDVCAPCPTNPNLLAITFHVKGTKKFEDTFHEPVSSLFLYDRAAKKRKRIVPEDMLVLDPVWSSDGKTIFFSGYRALHYLTGDPFQIYRISPDGAGLKALCKGVSPSVGPPSD